MMENSWPEVTSKDLKEGNPWRINSTFKFILGKISLLTGSTGQMKFGKGPFDFQGPCTFEDTCEFGTRFSLRNIPQYTDNDAAKEAGAKPGTLYRTATGQVMIVF
jgi:hypothetical protein